MGYNVKYQLKGQTGQVRMDRDPGSKIPVNDQGQLILTQNQGQAAPAQ